MIIPIHPFLLDIALYALHQPACTCRDPRGKTLWCKSVLPFPEVPAVHTWWLGSQPRWAFAHTLDYMASIGAHPGMPRIVMHWMQGMWQQLCTWPSVTPNTMHTGTNWKVQQSCGSGTNRQWGSTPGSHWDIVVPAGNMALLTKVNTRITFEGSRLQLRDMLDASWPTHIRHQSPMGFWW